MTAANSSSLQAVEQTAVPKAARSSSSQHPSSWQQLKAVTAAVAAWWVTAAHPVPVGLVHCIHDLPQQLGSLGKLGAVADVVGNLGQGGRKLSSRGRPGRGRAICILHCDLTTCLTFLLLLQALPLLWPGQQLMLGCSRVLHACCVQKSLLLASSTALLLCCCAGVATRAVLVC